MTIYVVYNIIHAINIFKYHVYYFENMLFYYYNILYYIVVLDLIKISVLINDEILSEMVTTQNHDTHTCKLNYKLN